MFAEILELIAEKKYTRLRTLLSEINPADIAEIFEEADKKDIPIIFRILPKELAAEVFTYLESDRQQLLIEALSDKELRDVMDELFMDDTVDIIEECPQMLLKEF